MAQNFGSCFDRLANDKAAAFQVSIHQPENKKAQKIPRCDTSRFRQRVRNVSIAISEHRTEQNRHDLSAIEGLGSEIDDGNHGSADDVERDAPLTPPTIRAYTGNPMKY